MLSVADVKGYIGANAGDVTGADDAYFADLEADVVEFLSGELDRRIGSPAAIVETAPGLGGDVVYVRGFLRAAEEGDTEPAVSVEVRGSLGSDWSELDSDAIEWDEGGDCIYRVDGSRFPCGDRLVRVSYLAGYSLAVSAGELTGDPPAAAEDDIPSDAPRDMQRLVRLLCAVWHRTRPQQRAGGDGVIDLQDVPMSARMTMQRYARARVR